jgi:hypothetical protein
MLIDDRARFDLHAKLRDVLGTQEADTLMAHLPPVGWADVATKQDIAVLRLEMEAMRHELRAEIANVTKQTVLALAPLIVAFNGIAVGLAVGISAAVS